MRVLLENTTFQLHNIVRIAGIIRIVGIIRVAGIIRGRALYEEIRYVVKPPDLGLQRVFLLKN